MALGTTFIGIFILQYIQGSLTISGAEQSIVSEVRYERDWRIEVDQCDRPGELYSSS